VLGPKKSQALSNSQPTSQPSFASNPPIPTFVAFVGRVGHECTQCVPVPSHNTHPQVEHPIGPSTMEDSRANTVGQSNHVERVEGLVIPPRSSLDSLGSIDWHRHLARRVRLAIVDAIPYRPQSWPERGLWLPARRS
jgi:hypothetical protein